MKRAAWLAAAVVALAVLPGLGGCGGGIVAGERVKIGSNRELQVNGRQFFPLLGFSQSPKSFDNAKALGLNGYFMPGKVTAKEYLDPLGARGLYAMVPFDAEAVGHQAVLAWVLPHEPDATVDGQVRMSPEEIAAEYQRIKAADRSHPVVLDFSPNFMLRAEFAQGRSEDEKRQLYGAYARSADILTYNVYPVWNYNQREKMSWVAEAADDLQGIVGDQKPFFAMIETGKGGKTVPVEQQTDLSIREIKAQVWMAIVHGATGIIYFTHQFQPAFTEYGLSAEKQAGINSINEQITSNAAAILAPRSKLAVGVEVTGLMGDKPIPERMVNWMVTEHGGYLYIFVANAWGPGDFYIKVNVPGLKYDTDVEVVGENIVRHSTVGYFVDASGPFAVRIYRIGKSSL